MKKEIEIKPPIKFGGDKSYYSLYSKFLEKLLSEKKYIHKSMFGCYHCRWNEAHPTPVTVEDIETIAQDYEQRISRVYSRLYDFFDRDHGDATKIMPLHLFVDFIHWDFDFEKMKPEIVMNYKPMIIISNRGNKVEETVTEFNMRPGDVYHVTNKFPDPSDYPFLYSYLVELNKTVNNFYEIIMDAGKATAIMQTKNAVEFIIPHYLNNVLSKDKAIVGYGVQVEMEISI